MTNKILFLVLTLVTTLTFASVPSHANTEFTSNKINTIIDVSNKTKKAALQSAVRVVHKENGSYGSGSYILIDEQYFVLTAAHVVDVDSTFSVQNGFEVVSGDVVYRDDVNDIAFLKVQQMKSRTALKYKVSNKHDLIGENLMYAGYPNSEDLFLFFGRVAGYRADTIMLHSYAWMGASGSVVLDMSGRIVGVLHAIDVGYGFGGPQLVEDMVWVASIHKVNLEKLKKNVVKRDVNIHKKIKTN